MCGICGIWEYGASEGRVDLALVAAMRDEMQHRGPDDAGELSFDNDRGGLGFRRLSIVDLSPGGTSADARLHGSSLASLQWRDL